MQSQVDARERGRDAETPRAGEDTPPESRSSPRAPREGSVRSDRTVLIIAFLALAVHGILAWQARPAGLETSQDAATYYVLGDALLDGEYRERFRVDAPVHSLYPPGYPAQLAVLEGVFGDSLGPIMAWGVLLSVATLGMMFLVLRKKFSPWIAVGTLCLLAVNPILIELAPQVRAETPFMFFAMASIALLADREPSRNRLIAGCAAAIFAALTRTAGVVLLPAVALHLLLMRRKKALAGFLAVAALTVGSWLAWTVLAPEKFVGRSYVADALTIVGMADSTGITGGEATLLRPDRLVRRTRYYAGIGVPWSLQMPTLGGTRIDNAIGASALIVLLFIGGWVAFKRWRVSALYMLSYFVMLFLWTWQAQRFLAPVIPLLATFVVVGGATALRRFAPRWTVPLAAALLVPFVWTGATRTAAAIESRPECDRDRLPPAANCMTGDNASFLAAIEYVRESVPDDAVILTLKPAPFYVYTGLRSLGQGPVLAQTPETFADYLTENGATHVLLGHLHTHEPRRLLSRLEGMCDRLSVEKYFPPRTWLLKLRAADADPEGTGACEALARYRTMSNEA